MPAQTMRGSRRRRARRRVRPAVDGSRHARSARRRSPAGLRPGRRAPRLRVASLRASSHAPAAPVARRGMNEALPAERDHVGLGVAPRRQRPRPLLRAPQIEHLLARLDHAAVHEARDEGRELARCDRDHRFVEQREALRGSLHPHQRPPVPVAGEGREVGVIEAFADRRSASAARSYTSGQPPAIALITNSGRIR